MFLRRIFRKRKLPKPPKIRELTLDSLEEEIKNLRKIKFKNIEEAARPKIDEIFKLCESINKSAKALAETETSEFVHPRLEKTALEARRLYVQKVTRAIDRLKPPVGLTWQGLLSFYAALNQTLKLMMSADAAHRRHILVLFKQPMQNTQRLIHMLYVAAIRLGGIIEQKTDEIKAFDGIFSRISDQRNLLQHLARLHAQEDSLRNQAKDLEAMTKKKSAELDQLVNSHESKRLEDIRRELDRIEHKIAELENKAKSAISDLHRPFRKKMKLMLSSEHKLDKDKAMMLKLCIEKPLNAFQSGGENLSMLTALLQDLATGIKTGEVKLDPHERQKKLKQIRWILDGGLSKLKAEYVELRAERASKKNSLETSPIPKQEAELKRSLDFNRSELMKTQSKLNETSKVLEKIRREIDQNKLELESSAGKILGIGLKIA